MQILVVTIAAAILTGTVTATAQQFVAPPRTIADITAILDQEKPEPWRASAVRVLAEIQPSNGTSRADLAKFYYERCRNNAAIGDLRKAIADCEKAEATGRGTLGPRELGQLLQGIAIQYEGAGDPKKAIAVLQQLVRDTNVPGAKGWLFNTYRHLAENYILLGDFAQAEAYVRRSQTLLQEAKGWSGYAGYSRAAWNADMEQSRARLFEARGQFAEAEQAFARAEMLRRESLALAHTQGAGLRTPANQLQAAIDEVVALKGRMKARQGKIAEGEADVRRALLSRLKAAGKYNIGSVNTVGQLANLLIEQGRFSEAEKLTRVQIDVQKALGMSEDSQAYANSLNQLASILNLLGRSNDAAKIYAELEIATKGWEPARQEALQISSDHIVTLYNTSNIEAGIAAAGRLLARHKERYGEQHVDTALSRGLLGMGLLKSGRNADALRQFRLAMPILTSRSREIDNEDATVAAAREQRIQSVVESYLILLTRTGQVDNFDPVREGFPLAEAVRGRTVQRALAASAARSTAATPALAGLIRRTQDLEKQISAQLGLLNNVLAMSPAERDDNALKALQVEIEYLRDARDVAKKELAGKFRDYASLIEPHAPNVDDIRAIMQPNEAFLSFYFGKEASFVWAVSKSGPVAFSAIAMAAADIDQKVQKLREALEPSAAMVSDIPPFDLAVGYDLYSLLLKPVEGGWKDAKSLIVVTNGALGLLPLSLLPTAPAQVKADDEPLFISYRNVPWLMRTHAITTVPSAAALRALRELPPGKSNRGEIIAFGDPVFSKAVEGDASRVVDSVKVGDASNITRGVPLKRRNSPKLDGVDSADLAMLPQLPDTADELKSIALALQADPSKVLNLGRNANEKTIKTMDLSGFKVLAFATHGLVPGELNGLTQPALALSSPAVTGDTGDGLLTMEEILALKLDADWVVLSACNTGAGAGAGAEAASGLGRAFFYAGTRALLVTNWSVHSQSARELVTDLFKRQAVDPELTRGEALRQAMMALADGPGYLGNDGKTEFAYAHPLFWAPYSIIGDGGGR